MSDSKSPLKIFVDLMPETIIMGRLMGIDPFDLPSVEEAKVLPRQYLAET